MIQVFEILFPLGSSNFIFDNEDYPVVFLKVTGSVCSLKKKKNVCQTLTSEGL